jgi:hypothetical protein
LSQPIWGRPALKSGKIASISRSPFNIPPYSHAQTVQFEGKSVHGLVLQKLAKYFLKSFHLMLPFALSFQTVVEMVKATRSS